MYVCMWIHIYVNVCISFLAQSNDKAREKKHSGNWSLFSSPQELCSLWSSPISQGFMLKPVSRLDLSPKLQILNVLDIFKLLIRLLYFVSRRHFKLNIVKIECLLSLCSPQAVPPHCPNSINSNTDHSLSHWSQKPGSSPSSSLSLILHSLSISKFKLFYFQNTPWVTSCLSLFVTVLLEVPTLPLLDDCNSCPTSPSTSMGELLMFHYQHTQSELLKCNWSMSFPYSNL